MRKLKLTELKRPSVQEYLDSDKFPVTVVLDNIRSALNVGSIFRTADAFNVERVILTGITAKPPHREIQKTAIGATESVKWEFHDDVHTAVSSLQQNGYIVYPVEQTDQSIMLDQVNLPPKCAFVFGNEVDGVSEVVIEQFERSIEIPQFGTKHSMNVAVSVGVVLWEYVRSVRSH